MHRHVGLLALLALTMQVPANAGDRFSYSQLDAGIGVGEHAGDHFSNDPRHSGNSWLVQLSQEIGPHFFAFGVLHGALYDRHRGLTNIGGYTSEPIKKSGYQLGLGLHWPLSARLDLTSGLSWNHLSLRNQIDERLIFPTRRRVQGSGPGVQLGLRGLLGTRFDWTLAVNASRLETRFNKTGPPDGVTPGMPFTPVSTSSTDQRIAKGLNAGFRWQFSRYLSVGTDLYTLRFNGETDTGLLFNLRLQRRFQASGR